MKFFRRLWFCWIWREHNVWEQSTWGIGVDKRTGLMTIVPPTTKRTCLYCKKDFS